MQKVFLAITLLFGLSLSAQTEYKFNNKPNGFSLVHRGSTSTTLVHNLNGILLEDTDKEAVEGQFITLSGIYLDNEAGAPNLPSGSTFVAIPNGSNPTVRMVNAQTRTIKDVDLIPAPQPQLDDDDSPTVYQKDMSIYGRNAFYPATPFQVSETMTIRGVEMVQVGVMPFQYNPVTKELVVYENLELELTVEGGDGTYGDLRYRTPEWDQILTDLLLNREVLPEVDYGERLRKHYENRETGCELLIITPDNDDFVQLADSIKQFRTNQGVPTQVFTVSQCGGNDGTAIRNFIRNAYNNWDMPPAAVLILGDHHADATKGVVSFTMNNHPGGDGYNPYISDHAYSIMEGNHMPTIIMGRITGRDYDELYHMIKKDLDYERTPPTNPSFYDEPVTAMGFQLERWFQLCSEVVNGFWEYGLEKHPVRINAIYQGTPGSQWSSNDNTQTVLNYFGPNGCGYIPSTMSHLTDWSGNATKVNECINHGAFILQHRDHGAEELWGEPGYSIGNIKRLTNPDLTYVMSNNCLTGKFNYSGEDGCFAEAFHRHQHGALGLIAATQVSYSFVNDVYVWGVYDNMWPDFMPTYGTEHATNYLLPAFGNAAGKFFLKKSNWTDSGVKEITYYLFHHHGDPYMNLYSEVPQHLDVEMLPVLAAGSNQYQIKVDEGADICLTANGQIIGFGQGTGSTQYITVTPQEVGTRVKLTIKKQNYYRYEHELATIPNNEPYLIFNSIAINDNEGNGNLEADYNETCRFSVSLHNVGFTDIDNVSTTLTCEHPSVEIMDGEASYGTVNSDGIIQVDDAFTVHFGDAINDREYIRFHFHISNGTETFIDSVSIQVNAPILRYTEVALSDLDGNATDRLMPGTSTWVSFGITNEGHSRSLEQTHQVSTRVPYLSLAENPITVAAIEAGDTLHAVFRVDVSENAPESNIFDYSVDAESGYHTASLESKLPMGYTYEGFDDGTLNPSLGWDLGSGNKEWTIVEDETAIGGYCLQSPIIANKVKAPMFIALSCYLNTTFSFRHRTSTEEGDLLILYINNKEVGSWGGETDWETSEYELKKGNNLIKIMYKKDQEGSAGDDRVYIDDLRLPPLEELILYPGNDTAICEASTFIPNAYVCHQQIFHWYTDGDGSFDDTHVESPVYTFGPNDLMNKEVTLHLAGISLIQQQRDTAEVRINFMENLASLQNIQSPEGDTLVDLKLVSQSVYRSELETSNDFLWILEPQQAGELTGEDNQVTILWNRNFKDIAHLSYKIVNECGESDSSETLSIRVVNSSSVDEAQEVSNLEVYPNPANERIILRVNNLLGNQVVIRIIDPLGRTVFTTQKNIDSGLLEEVLGTSSLHGGLYNLQVIDGCQVHSTRIIIKK